MPAHVAILLLLGGTLWVSVVDNALPVLAWFAISVGLGLYPLSWRMRWLTMLGIALSVLGLASTQGLFYLGEPRTIWFTIWGNGETARLPLLAVYQEGVIHGLLQGLKIATLALFGTAVFTRYSTDAILAALRWFRLPPTACFLLTLVVRQIPILAQQIHRYWRLRKLRGPPRFASGWLPAWLRECLGLWRGLLALVFCQSDALTEGLLSRGITPQILALSIPQPTTRHRDKALLVLIYGSFAGYVILRFAA